MRPRRRPLAACLLLALASVQCGDFGADRPGSGARILPGGFLVRPYWQLGPAPTAGGLRLLWHAPDADAPWAVDDRPDADGPWRTAEPPSWRRIAVPGVLAHRVYHVDLEGLAPGASFGYRVRRGAEVVFEAEGRAPKAGDQPHRFAIFGDCGAGTPDERRVADQAYRARPDFVLIPGDIVYTRGRISEYREKFWPIYDADAASPALGAPLLRSTLFVTAPGNHDVAGRDLGAYPDGLAYFLYWDQPLNGPVGPEGGPLSPPLLGPESGRAAFRRSAGPAYPRMANFSFDYGNAHWTVLDSNPYVDWTDPGLRDWVARDLAAAQRATWRFVTFHHPPFNSSRAHFGDQHMRRLVDLFEAGRVDVVWAGHVHNYQRTHPLTFRADRGPDGRPLRQGDRVPGRWTLDTDYDGRTRTRPRGVIYVITGGGGADLYYPEQEDDPASWQPYTCRLVARVHSLTVADVDGPTLTVRQLAGDGREVDHFVITKGPAPAAVATDHP